MCAGGGGGGDWLFCPTPVTTGVGYNGSALTGRQ